MKKLVSIGLIGGLLIGTPCYSGKLITTEHTRYVMRMVSREDQALLDAARAGNVKGIQKALVAGADVNALDKNYGRTALMHAVARGNNEAVKALICAGADVNAVVWIGIKLNSIVSLTRTREALPTSVLGFAFREGAPADVVNTLIESGAIIDYRGFFI